jgi:Ca2+-binding RTX toxin-like protein
MRTPRLHTWVPLFLMTLIVLGAVNAFAAANTVPFSRLDQDSFAITANELKPNRCNSLNLTNIVVISGSGAGTSGNDLILGSAGDDSIRGGDGDDCIVGGGGNDSLQGQKNNDILLGQEGDDTLQGNQDTDICDGGPGTDTGHNSCETEIDIP